MTTVKALLKELDLGKSVAEFDEDLERYFVETNAFRELIKDKVDIVAGDKGTGKTAIYRFIQKKYMDYKELEGVNMLAAFNPSGNPIFSQLTSANPCSETDYILMWKSYILTLVGNWILQEGPKKLSDSNLDLMLQGLGLRLKSYQPKTVFSKILERLPNFLQWKSAEIEFSATEEGIPKVIPRVEFGAAPSVPKNTNIAIEDAFSVLDDTLSNLSATVWVNFDRLDEAFQGQPEIEIPSLRALLRTYLDLLEFKSVKLKLFLRKDLFRRVTAGGFVNLTHINAKKLEIVWDEEDLLNLFCRRVRQNEKFIETLGIGEFSDQQIFDRIFPDQVDFGQRKPRTWVWMMRRIRDGNDIKPPRNLIDLVKYSQQAQLRKEDREARELSDDATIIEPDALRRGLTQLSDSRVNDTLLAEAGVYSSQIEKFRDGKAEHNVDSVKSILGVESAEAKSAIKPLVEIGFLEDIKGNYKIPALFREGLSVTQGKAFSDEVSDDDD